MELELGLKITHNRDDITSHTNLRIAKDHTGPLFLSRETETMFILIAYPKGFRRENIDIKINKDGNQIVISGMKAVQEMVLSGWIMQKKDVELRAFRKAFRIPDGIILDRIKAKFADEESSLTIVMPKSVKGMQGIQIEEVKEEEQLIDQQEYRDSENKKLEEIEEAVEEELGRKEPQENIWATEMFPEGDCNKNEGIVQEKPEDTKPETNVETGKDQENNVDEEELKKMEDFTKDLEYEKPVNTDLQEKQNEINQEGSEEEALLATTAAATQPEIQQSQQVKPEEKIKKVKFANEGKTEEQDQSEQEKATELGNQEPDKTIQEPEKTEDGIGNEIKKETSDQEKLSPEMKKEKEVIERETKTTEKVDMKGFMLRQPLVVAGSAILVSLIVIVIKFIRSKRR